MDGTWRSFKYPYLDTTQDIHWDSTTMKLSPTKLQDIHWLFIQVLTIHPQVLEGTCTGTLSHWSRCSHWRPCETVPPARCASVKRSLFDGWLTLPLKNLGYQEYIKSIMLYIYIYTLIYTYTYMCKYMNIHVYMYIYVYVYVCTYYKSIEHINLAIKC